jgi:anti-anti-sigma factor
MNLPPFREVSMEIKIIATTGRARGQAVEIRAAKFFIGRHDNCQLRPDIPDLAGIHALIEERESRYFLRDFGAEGGTGINDRVLHARETEIFDSDLVQIGPMVLTLSIKSKGEDRRHGLLHAPDGWPYLDGVEIKPQPAVAKVESSVPEPALVSKAPPRAEPFHALRPDSVAATAATMVRPPVAEPGPAPKLRPVPLRPIGAKPPGRRALSCDFVNDVMVVKILSTDLNEEETVSPVRYELRSLLDEEKVASRMVIDMGNTLYLSSRAVGVLLAHYQGLERKGASMRVCGVSKEIKPVLDQMRLSMLIDIYPTVEEAVNTPWE